MASAKPNPMHLALWAVAGATLTACIFFVAFLPNWRLNSLMFRCTVLLVPSSIGAIIWFFAQRHLSRGYADGLWSDFELTPVRALLTSPRLLWAAIAFVICAITALAFTKHSGALFYITTLPLNAIASMKRLLVPSLEPTASAFGDWRNFRPIHSDHWGEPAQRDQTPLPS